MNSEFWAGKKVFLTGHTGFKGSWLALWLQSMGAEVHGYALAAPTSPNLYSVADIDTHMSSSTIADLLDAQSLNDALHQAQPDIVFHLAAQSLVRYSYDNPVETYAVNVMGSINLFEAVRNTPSVKAVVVVTSDKCYENREWPWGYRENEALGGYDPYSSSKGCVELVTSAYRQSFFAAAGVQVASARAGNVIGGGDWASDRILPDFFRAMDAGQVLQIRSPYAIRPWQHVLEPLSGYLSLGEMLLSEQQCSEAWNFGPNDDDAQSVQWIVETLGSMLPDMRWSVVEGEHRHEANFLKLDSSKARCELNWRPKWRLESALERTVDWHVAWSKKGDMRAFSLLQLADYSAGTLMGEQ